MNSCGKPPPGDTVILYSEFTPMMGQINSLKLVTMNTCSIYDQTFTKNVFLYISNLSDISPKTHLTYGVYYIRT